MWPRTEPFMYLFGDSKSGKTTFLRSVAREIARLCTPREAQIFVVDVRRTLLGEIPEEYLAGYLTTREAAQDQIGGLTGIFKERMPGDQVTSEQLRHRSWWTGPEVWILVDDYDLVAASPGSSPLLPLQPFMAQARDVGLHVLVTRRMGGASRAAYEPILQAMTELGATGILLSGSPDEGVVVGRVRPVRSAPGRAQVVSRDLGLVMAQLAWTPPRS